jgi:hypothetical protein
MLQRAEGHIVLESFDLYSLYPIGALKLQTWEVSFPGLWHEAVSVAIKKPSNEQRCLLLEIRLQMYVHFCAYYILYPP